MQLYTFEAGRICVDNVATASRGIAAVACTPTAGHTKPTLWRTVPRDRAPIDRANRDLWRVKGLRGRHWESDGYNGI